VDVFPNTMTIQLPSATPATAPRSFTGLIGAGLMSWVAIGVGFFGLHMLMQERPEFVGQPMRSSKTELIQESPRVVIRKLSDDVAVIKTAQPSSSEITFDMRGRRDYRGLRTVIDMSGEFHARHVLTNAFDEPVFVLFKCPHPRSESDSGQGLLAGGLKLQASVPGIQENATDAWFWSGTIEPRGTVNIDISYQAASLKGVTYRIDGPAAEPVKHLRVAFNRHDLTSIRFESGDGPISGSGESVLWERKDFLAPDSFSASIVESRNLHGSLLQLLEIGPIICLLFLLAVTAIILARQPLTSLQLITIAAGYALYFPLMLYLSSRFSFTVALIIAAVVPGALLVNYARLLLGTKTGLLGGVVFLLLYQVFPTLAAFAGWNRGMVLLCLGVVTFGVLINLQNQALKRKVAAAAVALLCLSRPAFAADVQVIVPGQLVTKSPDSERTPTQPVVSFEPAEYRIVHEPAFFRVEVKVPFQVLRDGEALVPLFTQALHLQAQKIESPAPDLARFGMVKNRLALLALRPGAGVLQFVYRVAIENHEGRKRAQFPMLIGPSGNVQIESARPDLENITGSLWAKSAREKQTVYEIGVAGEELLTMECREQEGVAPAPEAGKEFYGIGITRAQHLTVINSDGSCAHFAEFELPAFQTEELRLRLPPKARLISVSINGVEATAPALEDQLCRIRLPAREAGQAAHRLSFRLAYPPVALGFIGSVELPLPEVFQTVGTLEWIVALPGGFETQVLSSGLTVQKTPPDLTRFGDYGRILKSHPQSSLAKDLAPPGPVSLNLHYRQAVPAMDR
ncbi:MAG: hypothetical protein ABIZ56_04795, partial [Chthoniobacteraceae bacterium]